ncbi:hypothetical protein QY880_06040 [Latilactobacillus sakei]
MIKLQVNLKNTQTEILFDQQILTIYSEQPATLSPFDGLLLHTNQQQITQIDYLGWGNHDHSKRTLFNTH